MLERHSVITAAPVHAVCVDQRNHGILVTLRRDRLPTDATYLANSCFATAEFCCRSMSQTMDGNEFTITKVVFTLIFISRLALKFLLFNE